MGRGYGASKSHTYLVGIPLFWKVLVALPSEAKRGQTSPVLPLGSANGMLHLAVMVMEGVMMRRPRHPQRALQQWLWSGLASGCGCE